jgi:uncharacterized metal-binding protein YceD (DUF177 family)
MTIPTEPPLLAWSHETTEIPERGLKRARSATEAERVALAKALDLVACEALDANYQIVPTTSGHWEVTGGLDAAVTQACVISLEPVAARVAETFSVEFRRDAGLETPDAEREVLSGSDIELLDGDRIDIGRIVYETLSAGLDPYPRKAGAEFDWADPKAGAADSANPFVVLKKLKGEG